MAKMNVYKAHELRMWAKDILIPAAGFVTGYIMSDKDKRNQVKAFCTDVKEKAVAKYKEVFHKV